MNGVFSIPACCPQSPADCGCALTGRFLAGPENRPLAWAVQQAWQEPGAAHCPLVIYGPAGSGKSLLLSALARCGAGPSRSASTDPPRMLSADQWSSEFARAHAQRRLAAWRDELRGARCLLIDQLEGLQGQRAAQEELCRTLDVLARRGATVVLVARSAPASLAWHCAGLATRLGGGLVMAIEPPSLAVRLAIARQFVLSERLRLTDEALDWLVERETGPVGQLLARLAVTSEFCGDQTILDRAAVEAFWNQRRAKQSPSLAEIARVVSRQFGVRLTEVRGPGRQQSVVLARGVAMYLARLNLELSLEEIGHYFSKRDHSTVLHQCQKLASLCPVDPPLRAAVEQAALELGFLSDGPPPGKLGARTSPRPAAGRRSAVLPAASAPAATSPTTGATTADSVHDQFSSRQRPRKPLPR